MKMRRLMRKPIAPPPPQLPVSVPYPDMSRPSHPQLEKRDRGVCVIDLFGDD